MDRNTLLVLWKDLFLASWRQIWQVILLDRRRIIGRNNITILTCSFSRHRQARLLALRSGYRYNTTVCDQIFGFSQRTTTSHNSALWLQIWTTFLVYGLFTYPCLCVWGGKWLLTICTGRITSPRSVICRTCDLVSILLVAIGRSEHIYTHILGFLDWTCTARLYFGRESRVVALESRCVLIHSCWRLFTIRSLFLLNRVKLLWNCGSSLIVHKWGDSCVVLWRITALLEKLGLLLGHREIVNLERCYQPVVLRSVRRLFIWCGEEKCIVSRLLWRRHLLQLDCLDWGARRRVLPVDLGLVVKLLVFWVMKIVTHGETGRCEKRSIFLVPYICMNYMIIVSMIRCLSY